MKQGYKEQNNESHIDNHTRVPGVGPAPLTQRDTDIIQWVHSARIATRQQIQRLFFTEGGRSRCQYRLTLLHRNRYLDVVPRKSSNEPNLYYISRRSVNGLRLLRTLRPDGDAKPHSVPMVQIQHSLNIASCHIAVVKASAGADYSMRFWLNSDALSKYMVDVGFLPDGYFQIARATHDGEKLSGFFLEVERSGKSQQALEKKFRLYGHLYYEGYYQARFGTNALRVLFLVGSDYGINPQRQITKLEAICQRLNVTIFRFCPLDRFLNERPDRIFTAEIWHQPNSDELCSLF